MSRRVSAPTEGNLALEPEWRREVSSRLQDYRVRRHGVASAELQSTLPFEQSSAPAMQSVDVATRPAAPAPRAKAVRKQRAERYEISIPIHENPAASVPADRLTRGHPGAAPAGDMLFPVAPLSDRRRAAVLDAALLLFSYGGMLALFTVLGGHIGWNKLDAIVTGATLALFYAQYFALFTIFGGATPGMMVRGLRVVGFDGSVPTSRQMAWRSFGYLISAGTCFLGFFWALWDEDHLTWQDRISQTYLTPAERFAAAPMASEAALDTRSGHQETSPRNGARRF
ncbi:MAG: RDD family protein [Acidobacteriia bacterium]|nr:RDD family protein [Terriglobia bacterium]